MNDENRFEIKKRQGMGVLGTDVRVVDEEGTTSRATTRRSARSSSGVTRLWTATGTSPARPTKRSTTASGLLPHRRSRVGRRERSDRDPGPQKDIIISGGENISSIELEDALFDHDAVADAAVIPAPSDKWGETPKAFVVPSNGDPTDPPVSADELTEFTVTDWRVTRSSAGSNTSKSSRTATGKDPEVRTARAGGGTKTE